MEYDEEPETKRARAQKNAEASRGADSKDDFEIIYPTLFLIRVGFEALTMEDEDMTSFFTRGNNSEFMLRTYNRKMEAQPICGKARKIRHLGVEFCMMLFANIIGFTTNPNKPVIVLNGYQSTGKSFIARAAGMIMTGTGVCLNKEAFDKEDYATIRSMTAPRADEYDRVSGTRGNEEWRGERRHLW